MAFSESLDDFLRLKSAGGLADPGTYDGATAVAVLFDNEYLRALGMVSTSDPAAIGKASVFPEAAVGKSLVIGAVTYTIRDRQLLDDGAFVVLQLEKQ